VLYYQSHSLFSIKPVILYLLIFIKNTDKHAPYDKNETEFFENAAFSDKFVQRRFFMETSLTELRYKTRDILQALDQNEEITLLHRGTVRGVIMPVKNRKKVSEHPFFGMSQDESRSVSEIMDELRGNRFDDI